VEVVATIADIIGAVRSLLSKAKFFMFLLCIYIVWY